MFFNPFAARNRQNATAAEVAAGIEEDKIVTPGALAGKLDGGAADTTLSGIPKVFMVKDSSGTPYYFKAYPTKA